MGYSTVLILHICGAIIGLLSGTAALIFRKGFRLHRAAGNIFFVSMLIMSASGAGIAAFLKPNMGNVFGGVITFYLVATGWLTVLRKEGETGLAEIGLLLVALAAGAGGLTHGWEAAQSATGLKEGYPPAPYLVFGCLSLWAAALDVRMLVHRGVSGAPRIRRHLWRMCVAFLIAALSFFLGKQQHFPAAIRGSQILNLPMFLILIAMIYWLIRVRVTPAHKKA
ncbi:MAG TPA: hypothetical protein VG075_07250 [Candidatus Acidoferrum sp.]|jgi:hypothetical protein|nr:hypothetical protein [Candidatus Acidoferrum sp.]